MLLKAFLQFQKDIVLPRKIILRTYPLPQEAKNEFAPRKFR